MSVPRPICFVAMPFGKKAGVDFDAVYAAIHEGVENAGLECIRADEELYGGMIHRPMLERLVVSEYVIADVTDSNVNVAYELGVRHGASDRPTIMLCASKAVGALPFDLAPLRVLTYDLGKSGRPTKKAAEALKYAIATRVDELRSQPGLSDNPLVQVTAFRPAGRVDHEKIDVFLPRIAFRDGVAKRIREALRQDDTIAKLDAIRVELKTDDPVVSLYTAYMALFIAYREVKGYAQMDALFDELPAELQRTPAVVEQRALAINRLAEAANDETEARRLRRRALETLDTLPEAARSSETWGIRGRIYKARAEAEGDAALGMAIEAYERGFALDLNDSYPGVNAVTLRLRRGRDVDHERLRVLLPTVRSAAASAGAAKTAQEKYWQVATRFELAAAAHDWADADDHADAMLAMCDEPDVYAWMYETTAKNIGILVEAFANDADAKARLKGLGTRLEAAESS